MRGYLMAARRRGILIALIVGACAGIGLAVSLLSDQTYEASASILVKDPTESAGIDDLQSGGSHGGRARRAGSRVGRAGRGLATGQPSPRP